MSLRPSTSPELRAAFLQRHDQERVSKTARLRDKTARVVAMWENRVAWWSREFDYARNFRFEEPKSANRDRSLDEARRGTAERVGPPPAPVAAPAVAQESVASPAAAGARARAMTSDMSVTVAAPSPTVNTATAAVARRDEAEAAAPRIAIKAWNPDTPYLRSLRAAAERCVPPVSGRA